MNRIRDVTPLRYLYTIGLVGIVFLACVTSLAVRSNAGDAPSHRDQPELLTDSQNDLGNDFIHIAFSETMWFEYLASTINSTWDTLGKPVAPNIYLRGTWKSMMYRFHTFMLDTRPTPPAWPEWAEEYWRGNTKLPLQGVINKWTGPITIGLGWPPTGQGNGKNAIDQKNDPSIPIIQSQILRLKDSIEKLTGLQTRFIPPSEETQDNFAHIRLVPSHAPQFFKLGAYTGSGEFDWNVSAVENSFYSAVPFTPDLHAQVEGYLLPHPDNSIGMAVCHINVEASEAMTRALASECLLRSLGLPDNSVLTDHALLGNWNAEFERTAKPATHTGYYVYGDASPLKTEPFPQNRIVKEQMFDAFTAYDRSLLSLLYCSAITAGMNKSEVIDLLVKDQSCFSR